MIRATRWLLPLMIATLALWGCAGTLSVGGDDDDVTGDDDATGDDDDDDDTADDDDSADDDDTGDDDDDTADDDDDDDDVTAGEYSGEIYVVIHSWWDIEGVGDATATLDGGTLIGEGVVSVDLGDGEVVDAPVVIEGAVSGDTVSGTATVQLSSLTEWLPDLPMEMTGVVEDDGTLLIDLYADMGWLGTAEGLLELIPVL